MLANVISARLVELADVDNVKNITEESLCTPLIMSNNLFDSLFRQHVIFHVYLKYDYLKSFNI